MKAHINLSLASGIFDAIFNVLQFKKINSYGFKRNQAAYAIVVKQRKR